MMRIFFAVELPREVRERLAAAGPSLVDHPAAVKWVEEENIHLTLQFMGEVEAQRLKCLLQAAQTAAQKCGSFTLDVCGIGAFPGCSRPRVIWAGLSRGTAELGTLADCLSQSIGVLPDKPFSPHITLGRVREGRRVLLSANRDFSAGSFHVDGFSCVRSTLTPAGPVYSRVAFFPLN